SPKYASKSCLLILLLVLAISPLLPHPDPVYSLLSFAYQAPSLHPNPQIPQLVLATLRLLGGYNPTILLSVFANPIPSLLLHGPIQLLVLAIFPLPLHQ